MATSTARKTTSAPAKKAAAPVKQGPAAPARKSASAKPPVKTSPAKKTTASAKPADDEDASLDAVEGFLKQVIEFIKQGVFDFGFTSLIDAIEERETEMAKIVRESEKKPAKKAATVAKEDKKVPLPTRASTFVPEVGVVYAVADGPAKGASFKFAGFFKGDENKAKGEITKTVDGYPVGKKVVLPTSVLRKPTSAAARRRAAK